MRRPVAILLLLAGCGGSGSGGDPGAAGGGSSGGSEPAGERSTVDAEALCAEVIAAQCSGHLGCCPRDDGFGTEEECTSLLEPLCVQDLSGTAYASGRIAFDPEAYAGALERLRAAAEACEPVGNEIWSDVFVGTVGEGGDCTPPEADYSALLSCAPGLACVAASEEADARSCAPRAGDGEACLEVDCAEGLFCDAGGGRDPVCRALRPEGRPCTAHGACESGICGEDERCAPRSVEARWCDDLTYP